MDYTPEDLEVAEDLRDLEFMEPPERGELGTLYRELADFSIPAEQLRDMTTEQVYTAFGFHPPEPRDEVTSVVAPRRRVVVIESPFAPGRDGDVARNISYARAALRDSLVRGEAPFASHLLYTQDGVLRDDVPEERELGLSAGAHFRMCADRTVVYTDLGISPGMLRAIHHAQDLGHRIEFRKLAGWAQ
jgi:hypothetical protein